MQNSLVMAGAPVPDVAAAVTFCEKAFSLRRRFLHESGMYAEMETGATALAFAHEQMAEMHGIAIRPHRSGDTPAGVEICFVTDAPEQAYAHAVGSNPSLAMTRRPCSPQVRVVGSPTSRA